MTRRWIPLAVIAFASLSSVPAASANTSQSSNWAGYAAHRSGVRFTTVTGGEVTVTLTDLTRRRSFTTHVHPAVVDTTSAEWIVEAPSVCSSSTNCHVLPLADFGSAGFSAASATTSTGHRGTIEDRRWSTTRISLAASGRTFVSDPAAPPAMAAPSSLWTKGSAFTVTYQGGAGSPAPITPLQTSFVAGDRLAHPHLQSP